MPSFILDRGGWPLIHKIMSVLGYVMLFAVLFAPIAGKVEGRYAPAASNFLITQIEPVEDALGQGTLVWGTFEVLRANECSFDEIEWTLDGAVRSVPVDVEFLRGARIRDNGLNEYGPWRLNISPSDIHNTRVEVYHTCFLRPWRVKTYLWP